MAPNFKLIRARLGVTQAELATPLGVTQGSISFYENGQIVPPLVAQKLIAFAKTRGVALTFDDIYGGKPRRKAKAVAAGAGAV